MFSHLSSCLCIGSFCHQKQFLVCVSTPGNKGLSNSENDGVFQVLFAIIRKKCNQNHLNWFQHGGTAALSESLLDVRASKLSQGQPRHPAVKTNFSNLYLQSHSFSHYPELMTICELFLLSLHHDGLVQCLHYCCHCIDPPADLMLLPTLTLEQEALELFYFPIGSRQFTLFPSENHSIRFGGADR